MRYKRCLLVRPPYYNSVHAITSMPVGLGYISEALHRNKVDYDVFDMAFKDQGIDGYELPDLINKIKTYKPDIIGFSLMTLRHRKHYELIKKIKNRFPEISIAAGGPHLSTIRNKVLEDCQAIDFGFVLEGDESFPALCRGDDFPDIKGLIYRSNGNIVYTGNAEFIRELDSIPYPRYKKFEINNYPENTVYHITSRGCPHQCTYCPVKLSIGRKFRCVSAGYLVNETKYWYDEGIRNFIMWDDNFTYFKKRVLEFCDLIESQGLMDCNFMIPNGIRADKVDRDMLLRMKEIGFSHISIGVESGSNKVLKLLKKGETVEQIESAIKDATELGYKVFLYYILGSPGETLADVEKSFDLALKYPVFEARFYKLIPFPGTELFEWVKARNLFVRSPEDYLNDADHFDEEPCFVTEELSYEDRIHIYRRGQEVSKQIRINRRLRQLSKYRFVSKFLANLPEFELYKKNINRFSVIKPIVDKVQPLIMSKRELHKEAQIK